jgi:hypothetical protein
MTVRVNAALAALEEHARQGCPGWETWVISTHDRRLLWSAKPDGALVAVIEGETSAARRHLANAPDTGIGRDKAAVLAALVAALEKLATRQ